MGRLKKRVDEEQGSIPDATHGRVRHRGEEGPVTQRVFLHPGPLKTGTTYLQSLLCANRESFLAQDVTIVGDQGSHHRVANELMRRKSPRTRQVPKGAWNRTRAAVLRAPGDVVMSCERYSLFRVEHARRVLEDLADREVHVVLTLRDLVAVLPARWQEGIKNGGTATWAQFQDRIAEDPAQVRKMTRASSTLEAWAAALPAERIHVVTVPPSSAPGRCCSSGSARRSVPTPLGWRRSRRHARTRPWTWSPPS